MTFDKFDGARLYDKGDACLLNSDGHYVCLGRLDSQIKFRGYRIELGEIEARITDHAPGVVDVAVVVLCKSCPTGDGLVAYVRLAAEPTEASDPTTP